MLTKAEKEVILLLTGCNSGIRIHFGGKKINFLAATNRGVLLCFRLWKPELKYRETSNVRTTPKVSFLFLLV